MFGAIKAGVFKMLIEAASLGFSDHSFGHTHGDARRTAHFTFA
jgi:hypothetical protein